MLNRQEIKEGLKMIVWVISMDTLKGRPFSYSSFNPSMCLTTAEYRWKVGHQVIPTLFYTRKEIMWDVGMIYPDM